MKKRWLLLLFLMFSYLLFFPQSAAAAAREGLILWYQSVLPVLFPFLFLSSLFLQLLQPEQVPAFFRRLSFRLFGCSACGAFAVLGGFLCGFPVGAKLAAELYRDGKIDQQEACRLSGFANNLSPGFLLSYVAADQLGQGGRAFLFPAAVLGAALLYGLARTRAGSPADEMPEKNKARRQTKAPEQTVSAPGLSFSVIDSCIYDSVSSALKLCAYITLFSVLSGAAAELSHADSTAFLILRSVLEVTNGVRLLAAAPLPFEIRYLAVTALCAFGGISALAQSAGIAGMDTDFLLQYIKSRAVITLLSVLLSAAFLYLLPHS